MLNSKILKMLRQLRRCCGGFEVSKEAGNGSTIERAISNKKFSAGPILSLQGKPKRLEL
jgi:hypothetical protein